MAEYKIVNVDGDFYIAQKDFQRDGWVTRAKINTQFSDKRLVKRGEKFIEPNQKYGDVSFRFGADEDDNLMSVGDASPVKVTWMQAQQFISAFNSKENFNALRAHQVQRSGIMERALTNGPKLL